MMDRAPFKSKARVTSTKLNPFPKQIELRRDPLPKSGAGKILKRERRDPHWGGYDTRIHGT